MGTCYLAQVSQFSSGERPEIYMRLEQTFSIATNGGTIFTIFTDNI